MTLSMRRSVGRFIWDRGGSGHATFECRVVLTPCVGVVYAGILERRFFLSLRETTEGSSGHSLT